MTRPALTASDPGSKALSPRAIVSALTKHGIRRASRRIRIDAVVLPAPLIPPSTATVGVDDMGNHLARTRLRVVDFTAHTPAVFADRGAPALDRRPRRPSRGRPGRDAASGVV